MAVGIQIVAPRDIASQPIVGREAERLFGPRWVTRAGGTEGGRFRSVQLSQTDDHRLMSSHDLIVDGISMDAVARQILKG